MTLSVKLSAIAGLGLNVEEFGKRVARFASEFEVWKNHMAEVAAGRAEKYPGPTEHELIVKAIAVTEGKGRTSASPAFTIVDDTPTADDLLPAKKEHKARALLEIERVERERILPPPLLVRKINRQINKALSTRETDEENLLAKIKSTPPSQYKGNEAVVLANLEAKPARTPEDERVLADNARVGERLDKLDTWVANKLAEIHDLTTETVDAWLPGSFEE